MPLVAVYFTVSQAEAVERIALVIGNGSYAHVETIDHAASDMAVMADTLRSLDFDVEDLNDLDRAAMQERIEAFAQRMDQAGRDTIGLFFYAGHGFQLDGSNYLLPVDAEIGALADVEAAAINLDLTLAEIAFATNDHKLVILDVPNRPVISGDFGARPGFAVIDAPVGTLVAFGTLPGVSHDSLPHKGLYPLALANVMAKPGLMVEQVFQEVRLNVAEATDGMQVPWESSALASSLYLAGPPETKETETVADGVIRLASMDRRTVDLLSWTGIKDSGDPRAFTDYLARFPDGVFKSLAERRLERLAKAEGGQPPKHGPAYRIETLDQRMITQRRASVRAVPGSGGVIVATLEAGQAVDVTGDVVENDWFRIRLGDDVEAFIKKPVLGTTQPVARERSGQGSILPPSLEVLIGQWRGEYQCQWDAIGFTLEISAPSANSAAMYIENGIDAVFSFFPLPETPSLASGSFRMVGDYDPRDGTIILKGSDWIEQPAGLEPHNLAGRAEIGGGAITGRIETPGCSDFSLARDGAWDRAAVQSSTVAQ